MRGVLGIVAPLAILLAASCADLDQPTDPASVLVLTVTPGALPADGFSTGTIVAEIDPRTAERFRDISLSTTLGSFVGGTSAKDTTLVVTANSSGRAAATLRSSTTAGTAVVTAEIRDGDVVKVSRTIEVPFERVPALERAEHQPGHERSPRRRRHRHERRGADRREHRSHRAHRDLLRRPPGPWAPPTCGPWTSGPRRTTSPRSASSARASRARP